jgi:hypothetical protein
VRFAPVLRTAFGAFRIPHAQKPSVFLAISCQVSAISFFFLKYKTISRKERKENSRECANNN